jgi:hypothetical protein
VSSYAIGLEFDASVLQVHEVNADRDQNLDLMNFMAARFTLITDFLIYAAAPFKIFNFFYAFHCASYYVMLARAGRWRFTLFRLAQ